MPDQQGSTLELFISYAHEDHALRKELEKHLSGLKRQELIITWYDRDITAGQEWANEIDEHLETATLILLLISADFLASDYCYGIEATRALERYRSGSARVIPILLRPCDWRETPFGHLQALPYPNPQALRNRNEPGELENQNRNGIQLVNTRPTWVSLIRDRLDRCRPAHVEHTRIC